MMVACVGGFWFAVILITLVLLFIVSWGNNFSQNKDRDSNSSKYVEESEEEGEITPAPKVPEIEEQLRKSSIEHQIDVAAKKTSVLTDYILKLYATCSVFYQSMVTEADQEKVLGLIEQCYQQLK